MPVHDWTSVRAGIFHDFHHRWIYEISNSMNDGLLPNDFYALVEQHWGKYGPDVLTLEGPVESNDSFREEISGGGLALLTKPRRKATAEGDLNYYRQKRKTLTVRHVSDDRVIAMIEIVSPGNKAGTQAFDEFIEKAAFLIDRRIHLVVVDLFPPTKRDPQGIHGAIWEAITGEEYRLPKRKPLTVASYEADLGVRAFVEHFAVKQQLPDTPLFLEPDGCIDLPLEATYERAFKTVPKRWRDVIV